MLHDGWAMVCQVGLWGWIASTMVFIVKAFPSRDVFMIRPAMGWGGAVVSFFILWIVGMVMA